ncbi:hypothetical protein BU17DRAFT_86143 [Hysterangium stoloniferum]|nr:hypothetical protein BU17DRAFT_86143 [Hysterangium stoloniferum]
MATSSHCSYGHQTTFEPGTQLLARREEQCQLREEAEKEAREAEEALDREYQVASAVEEEAEKQRKRDEEEAQVAAEKARVAVDRAAIVVGKHKAAEIESESEGELESPQKFLVEFGGYIYEEPRAGTSEDAGSDEDEVPTEVAELPEEVAEEVGKKHSPINVD